MGIRTARFPAIPKEIINFLEQNIHLYKGKIYDLDATLFSLNAQIDKASKITNIPYIELLKRTDMNLKDIHPERLDGMIAEIRTIIFLEEQGFKQIELLQSLNTVEADLIAFKGKYKYAIEVKCLVDDYGDEKIDKQGRISRWHSDEIVEVITKRYKKKSKQLQQTFWKYKCDKQLFCVVINTLERIALNDAKDFRFILEGVYQKEDFPNNIHFAIITGRTNIINGIPDDIIYPSI